MRIAKYLSRAGLTSRREAERWVAQGRVACGGVLLTHPSAQIAEHDMVTVDGRAVAAAPDIQLWRFYKPPGVVVSRARHGEVTIYDLLPEAARRLMPVGRLDQDSQGLLLLTNHGGVKRYLELPSSHLPRDYQVTVAGAPSARALAELESGVTIEGIHYRPARVAVLKRRGKETNGKSKTVLQMELTEGKNREIRRIMRHVGHRVLDLLRTRYGCVTLAGLEEGQSEPLSAAIQDDLLAGYQEDEVSVQEGHS